MTNWRSPPDGAKNHLRNLNYDYNEDCVKVLLSPFSAHLRQNTILRIIAKAIESILNYLYIVVLLVRNRPDVIHFQWLPFIEKCNSFDCFMFYLIKQMFPSIRIILTVHNIIPHNLDETKNNRYKKLFNRVSNYIDRFIVHTYSTKTQLSEYFGISLDRIFVVYHGIFNKGDLANVAPTEQSDSASHILMFGTHSFYKGTDILINAISLMTDEDREKIKVKIAGPTDKDYFSLYSNKIAQYGIEWNINRVSEDELKWLIAWSDIVVLPYRQISQSGVLLEVIAYEKLVILSDQPSFLETLDSYCPNLFFKSGDSSDLAKVISDFVNNRIDTKAALCHIKNKKKEYSWENSAKQTISVYI